MNIDMRGSLRSRPVRALLALVTVPLLAMACASAGRQGARSAAAGDWNTAVEYYQRALQDDPDRPEYRVALSRAMVNAARVHINAGRVRGAGGSVVRTSGVSGGQCVRPVEQRSRGACRETSLQDLIDFIGDATGISVTYDEQFQDR